MALLYQTNLTSSFVITALKVSENVSYIMPSNSTTFLALTRTPLFHMGFFGIKFDSVFHVASSSEYVQIKVF